MLNSINSLVNFVQIWQKVISLVTMATNVDSKLFAIVFLFLGSTDHSVKVSSNSESVRAGALLEFFGGYRELMLTITLDHVFNNIFLCFPQHSLKLVSALTINPLTITLDHVFNNNIILLEFGRILGGPGT